MSVSEALYWLKRTNKRVLSTVAEINLKSEQWPKLFLNSDTVNYTQTIIDMDWEKLSKSCKEKNVDLKKVMRNTISYCKKLASLEEAMREYPQKIKCLKEKGDISDVVAKNKVEVLKDLQSAGCDDEKAESLMRFLETIKLESIKTNLNDRVEYVIDLVEDYHDKCITSLIGSIYAETVAQFNILINKKQRKINISEIEMWCQSAEKIHLDYEHQIYSNLKKSELSLVLGNCKLIQAEYKRTLKCGVRYLAYVHKMLNGQIAVSEYVQAFNNHSLRISNILKNCMTILSLSYALQFAAISVKDRGLDKWVKAAKEKDLSIDSMYKPIELIYKGKEDEIIKISGTVLDVLNLHIMDKPGRDRVVSLANVKDINNQNITMALPYMKFWSTGVVPGTRVNAVGKFTKDIINHFLPIIPDEYSEQLKGYQNFGISIERLNYEELAENNWHYWMILNINQYFITMPNSLAIEVSWQPGVDGIGNQLRYGKWYRR